MKLIAFIIREISKNQCQEYVLLIKILQPKPQSNILVQYNFLGATPPFNLYAYKSVKF